MGSAGEMIPEAQLKELEKVVRECYPETCVRLQPQPDTNAWLKEPEAQSHQLEEDLPDAAKPEDAHLVELEVLPGT